MVVDTEDLAKRMDADFEVANLRFLRMRHQIGWMSLGCLMDGCGYRRIQNGRAWLPQDPKAGCGLAGPQVVHAKGQGTEVELHLA